MWVRWVNKKGGQTKWHWMGSSLMLKAACGRKLPSSMEERNRSFGEPQDLSKCATCSFKQRFGPEVRA